MKRILTGLAVATAGAALLAGCTSSPVDPDPSMDATTSSSPSPVATEVATAPTATPPASPAPTDAVEPASASIPTDCTDVVDAETYAATMGDAPLNDPVQYQGPMGQVTPTTPAADADLREKVDAAGVLRCGWRDPRADITGLRVTVSVVDAATAEAYPAWLAEFREPSTVFWLDGVAYDCSDGYGGSFCQYTTEDEMYGVEMSDTVLVRDGVVVTVVQANVPTDDLMGSIVTRIWG
ncbi:hypothetical protein SOM11_01835 [Frigoribacterium sp. CFBP9039]|uniref:hypothetical protein n=1 Tax=unclassified Frigoribacterium TaxID=2627005 RepID=UPI001785D6C6|nr:MULTISPECIES: hypothetical protein [unclassified Frigoribacterium]MBD8703025.1 hypothetical protein [Frigoribacterium sp. CFBP 13712]MDY0890461.1 hypothetical protein [Frigoribacterium sp. CFBP9030]MDY0944721.1 hypothetical protein [Frigoribacterium sp. CFBP9039]